MKWFERVKCIEDLKQAYFKLAKKYHSDVGGNDETMKEINAEYSELHKRLKDIHRAFSKDGETAEKYYTAETETEECPEDFINIVRELLKLKLAVELCGRWLWISGETKAVKEDLKKLGCKYHGNKQMWSWHYPEDSAKLYKKRKPWTMAEIRNGYGSVKLKVTETEAIEG